MNSKLFVTKEHIAAIMAALSYEFCIIPNTTTTICAAVHPNGFKLATGESACVCPENFNKELGEKYAKEDAVKKANRFWLTPITDELVGNADSSKLMSGEIGMTIED